MTTKPTIEANKGTNTTLSSSEWNTNVLQQANYIDEVIAGTNTDKIAAAGLASPLALSGGMSATTGTFTGALSGTTATFTGAVQSNSHAVVEGTAAVTHAEVYPAQGSVASIANNGYTTVTLTFARAFASTPGAAGSCQTSAGNKGAVAHAISAISTTAVTMAFQNVDSGSQTLSNFSILAMGA